MKTAFLFKSTPQLTDITIQNPIGLYFTTVTSDLRFLDNVIINAPDYDLRLYIKQEVKGQFVGVPSLWILLLSEHCKMDNDSYEKAWNIVSEFCSKLFPYIKMGVKITHQKAWVYPNIPSNWNIERTLLNFESSQGVGVYWDDPNGELYEENGETKRRVTVNNIKADLLTIISSENILQQSHAIHTTIPSTKIEANKKNFHLKKDIISKIQSGGFDFLDNQIEIQLLRLYSSAISSQDFFASFLLFYQIIELIEKKVISPTKIDKALKDKIKKFITSDTDLITHKDRLMGAFGNIKEETSFQMVEKGLESILGKNGFEELDFMDDTFKCWRHTRGDLAHVEKQVAFAQSTFFENYLSIRQFCTNIIHILLRQKGFDI